MASKADEIIKLRNEGMAYALKIAKEGGLTALEEQVKLRGLLRVTAKFTPEELDKTIENISDRVYYNMLTMVYAVLHDAYGFGNARLKRFKEMFDRKVYLVGEEDPVGRHYARFEDFAKEANRLYGLGIDLDVIKETQLNNDHSSRHYVAIDQIVKYLLQKEHFAAVDDLKKAISEPERKPHSKKERQKAECRQISDRHNKFYMDSNEEESIEYWFNIFALALVQQCSFSSEGIASIWQAADAINGQIADGTETLNSVKVKLIDAAGIQCEFTKAGVDYGESA